MRVNIDRVNSFCSIYSSIYVGFSSLYVVDRCGSIGTYIPYTMLTFASEELSTIEWLAWDRGSIPLEAIKSFNFVDLSCPPSDVMVSLRLQKGHIRNLFIEKDCRSI